jgi:hypothetical protein
MQVPVSVPDAWNWMQNTIDGFDTFQSKLGAAYVLAGEIQNSVNPAITQPLTSCQLEEMALDLYGPYAQGGLKQQYYVPECQNGKGANCTGGTWQWAINTSKVLKTHCGVCYVASVRNTVPPGGSASMCLVMSPLPDPAADLNCSKCKQ